jgi:FkbM family methyltransferase
MTFVDIGVNKGDFSLQAARLMGDRGTVHAFEPEPQNCAWIRRSIARNGYSCITLHELALSDSEATADLHLGSTSGTHTLVPGVPRRAGGVVGVRTRRLDDVLAEAGCTEVDVVKIDVEGAEEAVLRGAESTLLGGPRLALLIDLHPPLVESAAVCAWLEERGFSLRQPHDLDSPMGPVDNSIGEAIALRGTW